MLQTKTMENMNQ